MQDDAQREHPGAGTQVLFPKEPKTFGSGGSAGRLVHRIEADIVDCEVEGTLPPGLNGTFFRVGPDPQYPKPPQYAHDIDFDGEGHASMFRIKDGHVDYRSRYVQTQRYKAQRAARRSLFGMYRNPTTDDPSVAGLSRGTANTQVFYHHGKLLAFKEDSPPVVLDPVTLETIDDYYTFGGALEGETFTAHPKIDSVTGDLVGFGYEAKGLGSDDIEILSIDPQGACNWHAWVKAPYASMLHDFAVTDRHIAFLTIPLVPDLDRIKAGGVHFGWNNDVPSYLGVMRRGGDGSDIRWFPGPPVMCTHTMGAWSEGDVIHVDMDGAEVNQFPFFPPFGEQRSDEGMAPGNIRRFTVDLSDPTANSFRMEILYPEILGVLARQDDRYHTLPYRYGFILSIGPTGPCWTKVDHQTGQTASFVPPPGSVPSEMCFVPRSSDAGEGDGYLIGIVARMQEGGRSDLVIVDTANMAAGPVATVKMPCRIVGQVHGFWVPGEQLPG